jgi:hypothetical protein
MAPGANDYSAMKATIYTDCDYENPKIIYDYKVAPDPSMQGCVGFWQENRHFVDCVRAGTLTRCSFADAAKTSELADRVLQKDAKRPRVPRT